MLRAQAHPLGADKTQRAHVRRLQPVLAHHRALGLVQRVLVVGYLHVEDMRRAEQPVGVLVQTEDRRALLGLVGAHALEHAHAVVQGVGEDVDLGLTPGHQLAVEPDDAVTIRHIHSANPCHRSYT